MVERGGIAARQAVDVGAHGVDPSSNHVAAHGVVGSKVGDSRGVLARAELVGVDVVSELALVQGAAHEVPAEVLVVEVVGEEHEHLGRADVDVAILQVGSQPDGGVLAEEARVQGQRAQLRIGPLRRGVGVGEGGRGLLVVVQDATGGRVHRHHEVGFTEVLLPLAPRDGLEAAGHDRQPLRLASLPVRLEGPAEVHVRHGVAADEDEVGPDDVLVVDQSERLAGADAVGAYDGVDDEAGGAAPRAVLDVLRELIRVRAAEDEHLLHAVAGEELEGVLDHRHVRERKQGLGPLQRDRAEAMSERVRQDHRLEGHLSLLAPLGARLTLGRHD